MQNSPFFCCGNICLFMNVHLVRSKGPLFHTPFYFLVTGTKRCSPVAVSTWLSTGFWRKDTRTSLCLSQPGGRSSRGPTPSSQVGKLFEGELRCCGWRDNSQTTRTVISFWGSSLKWALDLSPTICSLIKYHNGNLNAYYCPTK